MCRNVLGLNFLFCCFFILYGPTLAVAKINKKGFSIIGDLEESEAGLFVAFCAAFLKIKRRSHADDSVPAQFVGQQKFLIPQVFAIVEAHKVRSQRNRNIGYP